MSIYEDLIKNSKDLSNVEEETNGIDGFFSSNRIKLSSLGDLSSFLRVGDETLIHKAQKDLWRVIEGDNGDIMIERLFDPKSGEALKI